MSHYDINAGVPKTLMQHLIRWVSSTGQFDEEVSDTLRAVLDTEILARWRGLLGQNVIELDDLDAVCETIALTVGLGEESIDLDAGLADLVEVGSPAGPSVGKALAPLGAGRGTVVRSPLETGGAATPGGNERL